MIQGFHRLVQAEREANGSAERDRVRKDLINQSKGQSKLKGLFQSDDVVEFYMTILRTNPMFSNASCMSLRWGNDNLRGTHGGVSE
jgi:hypothetical protein